MDTRVITQINIEQPVSIFNQLQLSDKLSIKLDNIANDVYDNEIYARELNYNQAIN